MESNVLINIKTTQTVDNESIDPIELQTYGKFGKINGKYYVMYDESEITGFPETSTTIKIQKDIVTVMRKGRFNMKLLYKSNERNLCMYPTPYGNIPASIYTSLIKCDLSDNGGTLRVDYTLDIDNTNFMQNSLNVSIALLKEA